jgi:hypothetical protein
MSQHFHKLAPLLFTTISAFIVTPAHAQVPVESQNPNVNNISPISSELYNNSEKNMTDNSQESSTYTNKKLDVLAENSDNSSPTAAANTKSNPRIPISSRIFSVPTMKQ